MAARAQSVSQSQQPLQAGSQQGGSQHRVQQHFGGQQQQFHAFPTQFAAPQYSPHHHAAAAAFAQHQHHAAAAHHHAQVQAAHHHAAASAHAAATFGTTIVPTPGAAFPYNLPRVYGSAIAAAPAYGSTVVPAAFGSTIVGRAPYATVVAGAHPGAYHHHHAAAVAAGYGGYGGYGGYVSPPAQRASLPPSYYTPKLTPYGFAPQGLLGTNPVAATAYAQQTAFGTPRVASPWGGLNPHFGAAPAPNFHDYGAQQVLAHHAAFSSTGGFGAY